jgi:uncharacterized 2Fe-2S/4Fe-4S cluster protein (DUF4445 family)
MEIKTHTPGGESGFQVLALYEPQRPLSHDKGKSGYGIAVDIGTTTIALEMADMATGQRTATHTMVNGQRRYAADVVTRIQLASQGKQDELHRLVINDIREGVEALASRAQVPLNEITRITVTGNTTMLHLLLNMPCETLGRFPFTPVSVAREERPFAAIFGAGLVDCPVTVLPGVSAYVGADIVAGLHFCGDGEGARLLIDLGTNGEMALAVNGEYLVTSTAAGPAFEAGNISCGMGSVPGAVARVWRREGGGAAYETIGGLPPLGLCGTGVVDTAAYLLKAGLADETGLLDEEYFDEGFPVAGDIRFTQKDLREIQLAKSAVRSGIEVLLDEAGLTYADISKVYLAGGFGYKMDLANARALGIIPGVMVPKVTAVGNSALGGCMHALLHAEGVGMMEALVKKAREINLSAHPRFNDFFMEHMMFEV